MQIGVKEVKMKRFSISLVGGGSTYTPDMMEMLCLVKEKFPLKKITMYDVNAERQNVIGQYGEVLFREFYPELEEFVYTTDPEEAFTDIDFALVQIRQGGLAMREHDEKIPLKYGCVGQETCGAGGFAYGMRSIGAILDLIADIRKYSKEAWILNYSNPAAIVAEATKRVFPDDKKVIHICDMPISIMDTYTPLADGRTRHDVEPRYFGLNHFGWFTHLYDKKTGVDVLPIVKDRMLNDKNAAEELGFTGKNDDYWNFTFNHLFQMVKDFPQSLPNTYMQYYLYPRRMVEHSDISNTRYDEVKKGREKRVFEFCKEIGSSGTMKGTPYDLTVKYGDDDADNFQKATIAHNDAHATYIVELAMSIAGNLNEVFLIMTKNNGIIPNIDSEMMLEVACRVGANGAEGLNVGPIASFEKGLLENQYAYEKLTVDAAMEGSYQKALQALVLNRCVNDAETARKILNEFITVNGDYFPKLI